MLNFRIILCFLLCFPAASSAQQIVVDFNVFELNVNQNSALTQLDSACETVGGIEGQQAINLQEFCDLLNTLDPNDIGDTQRLQEIADTFVPEEAFVLNDFLVIASDFQTTNVHARLNALRSFNPSDTDSPTNEESPDNIDSLESKTTLFDPKLGYVPEELSGAGASSDLVSRLGGFVIGHVSSGDYDGEELQQDADLSSSSLTLGADYRFSHNIVAGVSFGILQDETSFRRVSGGADSDGFNVTAYTTWYEADEGYIDAVLDIGRVDHELERSIAFTEDSSQTATASPTSTATSLTINAARNFNVFGFDLSGYGRLAFTSASIDAYVESVNDQSGFAPLFSIAKQSIKSSEIAVGFELSKPVSTNAGVIVPLLRLEYVAENERNKDAIEATLVATGTVARFEGEDRVAGYSNLGLGASAVFSKGRSAYAYYETHLQHELISQHWVKAGVRLEF